MSIEITAELVAGLRAAEVSRHEGELEKLGLLERLVGMRIGEGAPPPSPRPSPTPGRGRRGGASATVVSSAVASPRPAARKSSAQVFAGQGGSVPMYAREWIGKQPVGARWGLGPLAEFCVRMSGVTEEKVKVRLYTFLATLREKGQVGSEGTMADRKYWRAEAFTGEDGRRGRSAKVSAKEAEYRKLREEMGIKAPGVVEE